VRDSLCALAALREAITKIGQYPKWDAAKDESTGKPLTVKFTRKKFVFLGEFG
jgi:hypothetical protein